ncbi:hypothetical protein SAMN05216428_102161 [Nitrosospira sp. Nsp11]|nr:hypothetical protein SAMN05216428_102161 [Nitrosospira sp. Nsp11]
MPVSIVIWENSRRVVVDASISASTNWRSIRLQLLFSKSSNPSSCLNPGITVSALQMTPFEAASSMPDHKQGKGGGFGICVELHGFREGGPQLIHSLLRTA